MNDRIKYILDAGGGVNWIGISVFLVFFVLFLAVLWITLKRSKNADSYMAELPLDESEKSFE